MMNGQILTFTIYPAPYTNTGRRGRRPHVLHIDPTNNSTELETLHHSYGMAVSKLEK